MDILSRDIHDGRLLNLIRMGLEAGVMEEWVYHKTYSGTPQGGVLSPLLANIYLHELDVFIEDTLIPQYTCGRKRANNLDYRRIGREIERAKARNDAQAIHHLEQLRRQFPSQDTHDPAYRRLSYCRYADDFMLGLIGPKSEAEDIKRAIATFLREKLHLEMSTEKTLITHARTEHARFLGYAVSIYHADDKLTQRANTGTKIRSINGGVRLGVPQGLIGRVTKDYQRNGKVVSERRLLVWSDAHIIETYQQRYRGLVEYYKYAVDRSCLNSVKHAMELALVKTLAHKYRISVNQVYRKYRGTHRVGDREYVTLQVVVPTKQGERIMRWGAIPLKVVKPGNDPIDDTRHFDMWNDVRSDIIRRLQADTCELCGSQENCQVHHVHKLVDLRRRWAGRREKPAWVKRMIAIRRKTLVVCRKCHLDIHAGRPTPNIRKTVLESRVN